MKWNVAAERAFWRQKCLDSFWWFFKYAYGYDFNPKGGSGPRPWLMENTHLEACNWFERHALEWLEWRKLRVNKPKKLIAVVPRDWGKTTLFAQAGQAWLHLHDNDLATYTGAESLPAAKEILAGIKAVISSDDKHARFTRLYGNWYSKERTWKTEEVVTSVRTNLTRRDASFGTWAVNSGLTGRHPDSCFFDDPNTYERMERDEEWLQVVNRHQDTLIPVFQSNAFWMLTATRYGSGDHIGRSIRLEGVASVTGMPMDEVKVTPDGQWHVFYLDAIDERIIEPDGKPRLVMPQIWDWDRIHSLEKRNPERYWSQVRNNPLRSVTNPLLYVDAVKLIVPPETVDTKKLWITIHMDTAFKRPERMGLGDANVIQVWGHDRRGTGMVSLLDQRFSTAWDSKLFCQNLVDLVREWRPKCARIVCMTDDADSQRTGATLSLYTNSFAEAKVPMPQLIELPRSRVKGSKIRRMIDAAAIWKQSKVRVLSNVPGLEELLKQMTRIGKEEFDDFADAASDVFHAEVYQAMRGDTSTVQHAAGDNPFDDVLKPGPTGINAMNKIADIYAAEEAMHSENRFDIVRP